MSNVLILIIQYSTDSRKLWLLVITVIEIEILGLCSEILEMEILEIKYRYKKTPINYNWGFV